MAWFEIHHLESYYHRICALHGITLGMGQGDFISVIGSNGAGKTTLLLTLSRIVQGKGRVLLEGEELMHLSPREVIQKGVIHCPEGRMLFPHMSVHQNLLMGAFLRRGKGEIEEDLEQVFEYLPVLGTRQRQLAGTLSGGEQQMLAIGRAIMARPRLLTLDEPSFGLAPLIIGSIFDVLHMLNRRGMSLLLVEQNAWLAMEQTAYTYVLEEGRLVKEGATKDLLEDRSIRQAYLGIA